MNDTRRGILCLKVYQDVNEFTEMELVDLQVRGRNLR